MNDSDLLVAIMGATGSGKTSFINVASGSTFGVGEGLVSRTEAVQTTHAFHVDGRSVRLVDTPGFDDTTRSDFDILRTIADHLTSSYKAGKSLAGVIYIHRISDIRMSGIARKNFRMFRKICGDSTLRNVVIMTNMWGSVEPSIAEAREAELASGELLFKPVLEAGATMLRHSGTSESAHDVLRHIIQNHGGPLVLDVVRQIEIEHKGLEQTDAADACRDEMAKEADRLHREEMEKVQREIEAALKQQEEEARRRIEEEIRRHREEAERAEAEARRAAEEMRRQREELKRQMHAAQERAREEARRAQEEYERQRRHREWEARCAAKRAEREQRELQARIDEERRRREQEDSDDEGCTVQ
ncbi:unnamed protein product [Cyclocybe aegerita]|uniref:G domain-containing protein n=1 Tax=Cyclocybe aegerita TaxID=1973307 RepID=A0A8S0XFF8_CYCAE|nr:unnamed protein product [Cyclocybe aegerita]